MLQRARMTHLPVWMYARRYWCRYFAIETPCTLLSKLFAKAMVWRLADACLRLTVFRLADAGERESKKDFDKASGSRCPVLLIQVATVQL